MHQGGYFERNTLINIPSRKYGEKYVLLSMWQRVTQITLL